MEGQEIWMSSDGLDKYELYDAMITMQEIKSVE